MLRTFRRSTRRHRSPLGTVRLPLVFSAAFLASGCARGGSPDSESTRPPPAQPAAIRQDPAAEKAMQDMVQAYTNLPSYSDSFQVRTVGGKSPQVTTGSIRYKSPTLFVVQSSSSDGDALRVSDGSYYYLTSSAKIGQYLKLAVPKDFGSKTLLQYQPAGEAFSPVLAGMDPFRAPWGRTPESLEIMSPSKIDGVDVDIILARFREKEGMVVKEETVSYQMGRKDGLIRRIVTTKRTKNASGTFGRPLVTVETHTRVTVKPRFTADTFKFSPAGGATAVHWFGPQTWAESLEVGSVPPRLEGTDLNGQAVKLSDYAGKPVLLAFWATWCPHCRKEQPYIREAYKKYKDRGLEVVGISLDTDVKQVLNYTHEHDMSWPQLCDGQKWRSTYAKQFGIRSIPFCVLIGKDGKVVALNISRLQIGTAISAALNRQVATEGSGSSRDCQNCGIGKEGG